MSNKCATLDDGIGVAATLMTPGDAWLRTCFGPNPLAASSKVKGLPDRQLWQVLVLLLHIHGSALRQEVSSQGNAIVLNLAMHFEAAVAQLARQGLEQRRLHAHNTIEAG